MCRRPLLPLLALAALLSAPQASEALSCYQCSDVAGALMPLCSELDTGDDRYKTDCAVASIHSCSKVTKSDGLVIRGCYGEDKTEGCDERAVGSSTVTECFCSTDYCNSAGLTAPTLLLMLVAALLAAIFTA